MANYRKKRKDSTYFTEPKKPKAGTPTPRAGRDLIEKCPWCGEEISFEEAERWKGDGRLYHPEHLALYLNQLKSFKHADPGEWPQSDGSTL